MEIARGEHMGMEWIDIDLPEAPEQNITPGTRGRGGPVRLIAPKGKLPISWVRYMEEKPGAQRNYDYYLHPRCVLQPFDEAAAFPESRCAYYRDGFDSFDLGAWVPNVADIPATIELRFTFDLRKERMAVEARTLRKGAATWVRRKIESGRPFLEALSPILAYFERNCPRVPEEHVQRPTWGCHVAQMLSDLDGTGSDMIERWLSLPVAEHRDEIRGGWQEDNPKRTMKVPEGLLPRGIKEMLLNRILKTTGVLSEVKLEGGHRIVDDIQGSTVTLKAVLPEAVVNSLKGRTLSDLIEARWARGMTIRTARIEGDSVVLRTFSEQHEASLPKGNEDPTEVERRLRLLMETDDRRMTYVNEDAKPILRMLKPRDLLSAMNTLMTDGRVDLQSYGHAGWILKTGYTGIEIETCPVGSMIDVIESVLG